MRNQCKHVFIVSSFEYLTKKESKNISKMTTIKQYIIKRNKQINKQQKRNILIKAVMNIKTKEIYKKNL